MQAHLCSAAKARSARSLLLC